MPVEASERRKMYLENKERGYCPRCGNKIKGSVKTTYCEECKEYFVRYNKENALAINKRKRDRRVQRKQQRKCPRCGEPLPRGYKKILCVACLEKMYKYNNRKSRPEKNNNNNYE
jgi:Zn finger protein HypA/HybF involved in hydrogenase expression